MLIHAYFDESGKFKDHSVVAFAGVAGTMQQSRRFQQEWQKLLGRHGLSHLTMKEALNANREFSATSIAKGVSNRRTVLMQFVNCIKINLGHILGMALDVRAFEGMSSAARKQVGKNPQFTAFAVVMMELLDTLQENQVVSVVCDDEEELAMPIYKLYRKVQVAYPLAANKFTSLSFANDRVYPELQAADLCASILRLEARRIYFGEPYDYEPLFKRLTANLAVPNSGLAIIAASTQYMQELSSNFETFEKEYGHYGEPPLVEP